MKFSIEKTIFDKFPQYLVGVIVATGIDNSKNQEKTSALLKEEVESARKILEVSPLETHPHIQAWRNAFEKAGISPQEFAPSAEAMLTRISQGKNISNINPVINLLNTITIKHAISIGGHDLDKTQKDLWVRFSKPGDLFRPMNTNEKESVGEEIVYADGEEILTRRWVWWQGEKSKTDLNTKNIFIPIDALPPVDEKKLQSIMKELEKLVTSHLGGKTKTFILRRETPEITFSDIKAKSKVKKYDKIDELLTRGVENIYPSRETLEKVLRSGKKLRMYQGFDPSAPSLHLGNYVGLLKLKQFQELGHEVIFLVGDFTGMIGDPTDKLAARKLLTREQVLANCQSWKEQAARVLNFSGENPVKIMFNSTWNDLVTFKDLIEICANFTVQQMIERDMFQERLKAGKPIHLHEFLYPVAQGYDSVAMDVDLELGGNDQTFNMLAGRTLMKALKNKEKFVMTTKLLVDARGEKVGKTTGNALFLSSTPEEFYGGIMSFPDEVLPLGFELLTFIPPGEINPTDLKKKPMEMKKRLAFELVKIIYGNLAAGEAQDHFQKVFQNKELPKNAFEFESETGVVNLGELLLEAKMVKSLSEAKRLVNQKAIEVEGKPILEFHQPLKVKSGTVVKIGKTRFIKIKLHH